MLDEQTQAQLDELRDEVEVDVDFRTVADEPHLVVGWRHHSLCFRGRGLRLLHDMVERLAGPASTGGLHPESVRDVLIAACRTDDAAAASQVVEERLSASSTRWTLVEALPVGMRSGHTTIELGAGRLAKSWFHTFPDIVPSPFSHDGYAGAVLIVEVDARDLQSAQLLGRRKADLAKSVVALLDVSPTIEHGGQAVIGDAIDAIYVFGGDGPRESYTLSLVDREGTLYPGYRELADAAGRVADARNDWERRCLGAARWYRNALLARDPAGVITSCFIALEALTVRDISSGGGKSWQVSERVVSCIARSEQSRESLAEWIRVLYRRRNGVTHEAADFHDEVDASRLLSLTETITRRSIAHLTPMHREGEKACTTFEDAWHHHPV